MGPSPRDSRTFHQLLLLPFRSLVCCRDGIKQSHQFGSGVYWRRDLAAVRKLEGKLADRFVRIGRAVSVRRGFILLYLFDELLLLDDMDDRFRVLCSNHQFFLFRQRGPVRR